MLKYEQVMLMEFIIKFYDKNILPKEIIVPNFVNLMFNPFLRKT